MVRALQITVRVLFILPGRCIYNSGNIIPSNDTVHPSVGEKGSTRNSRHNSRSRRHQHVVSEKTIETAIIADKLMVDRHGREDLVPYLLTLMNVVSE